MSSSSSLYSHPGKLLEAHLLSVTQLARVLSLDIAAPQLLHDICALHDLGKATPFFQDYLSSTGVKKNKLKADSKTNHAFLGAYLAYHYFQNKYPAKTEWILLSFFAIRRHHSNLKSFNKDTMFTDFETLQTQLDSFNIDTLNDLLSRLSLDPQYLDLSSIKKLNHKNVLLELDRNVRKWLNANQSASPFVWFNYYFSLLLDADKTDAGVGLLPKRVYLSPDLVTNYKKNFNSELMINKIRETIYASCLSSVSNILEPGIYSIVVPTGLGKTLTSFAVALALKNKLPHNPRIIYGLPFLSIIDQTYQVLEAVFEYHEGRKPNSNELLQHHHLSEIRYKLSEDQEIDDIGNLHKDQLLIEGWNSEIIITTFVQLFETIIGYRNKSLKKFNKLAGSILILDETQNIPIKYWNVVKTLLLELSTTLKTYILFVTATKPALFESNQMMPLVDFQKMKIALNRTKIIPKFDNTSLNNILEIINSHPKKSILVILNTIAAADDALELVRESPNSEIKTFYLSTKIPPIERRRRINEIKDYQGHKLVISTQLIEAGVDLDFDIVIRDMGPLDAIIQAAGRCNRNNSKTCGLVYVCDFKNDRGRSYACVIYDSILIELTKKSLSRYCEVPEDLFSELINDYFTQIQKTKNLDTKNLVQAIYKMSYDDRSQNFDPSKPTVSGFKLIEENYETIEIFVELNTEATSVLNQYIALLEAQTKEDKTSGFLKIKPQFYQYVITVSLSKALQNLPPLIQNSDILRWIPHKQLNQFYDIETGYKTTAGTAIW